MSFSKCTRDQLVGISNDELGSMFSDYYKDVHGFRPRHVVLNDESPEFSREMLENAYMNVANHNYELSLTEYGRDALRNEGYYVEYEFGDYLDYKGIQYRVEFIEKEDGRVRAYDLNPIYITNRDRIKLSVAELIRWQNEVNDRRMAEFYGVSYEEYKRNFVF